jgi:hypothetical protein
MQGTKKAERKYNISVKTFSNVVTIYDLPFLVSIIKPGTMITPKEADIKYKSRKDLLQDCYEKEPVKITEYMVRKGALLLHHAYDSFMAENLRKGMVESDPVVVGEMIKDWKALIELIERSNSIILKEHNPPSCLINLDDMDKERMTHLHRLEKHYESLISKKQTSSAST